MELALGLPAVEIAIGLPPCLLHPGYQAAPPSWIMSSQHQPAFQAHVPYFVQSQRQGDPRPWGAVPHLWPQVALSFWPPGPTWPWSGLMTATVLLTTEPLHVQFPLPGPLPALCFDWWSNPSGLSCTNKPGSPLLHFIKTQYFRALLSKLFPTVARSSPFSGVDAD